MSIERAEEVMKTVRVDVRVRRTWLWWPLCAAAFVRVAFGVDPDRAAKWVFMNALKIELRLVDTKGEIRA